MQQRSQNGTATSSGFFSTSFFSSNKSSHDLNAASTTATTSKSTSTSRSRPGTSSGDTPFGSGGGSPTRPTTRGGEEGRERNVLTKVRKASFSSPSKHRRHASSGGVSLGGVSGPFVTDNSVPPALPDFAIAAAAKVSNNGYNNDIAPSRSPVTGDFGGIGMSRMPSRGNLGPSGGEGPGSVSSSQAMQVPNQTSDSAATAVHAHISETASKRISTLDYLRKA